MDALSSVENQVPGRLLLVDDEENILSSLKRLLRRDGYRIYLAGSGQEGLDILAREAVDVIISDQRMPHMTGTEFLRQVKGLYPDTLRIVLSGYTELESVTNAINEGAVFRFLTKPWNDEHLRQQVADAVRQKRIADDNLQLRRDLELANQQLRELLEVRQHRIELGEASLHFSHEVMSRLPIAVVGIDSEQCIVLANSEAELLFGHPVVGLFAQDILPQALLQVHPGKEEDSVASSHIQIRQMPLTVIRRDMGSRGYLLVFFNPEQFHEAH